MSRESFEPTSRIEIALENPDCGVSITTPESNAITFYRAQRADDGHLPQLTLYDPDAAPETESDVESGRGLSTVYAPLDLMRGVLVGAISRIEQVIEFLSKPNAVTDALVGLGPILDTAVNYYAKTPGTEVAADASAAGNAIKRAFDRYSQVPPEKRGEVLGGLGVDVLLTEIGGAVALQPIKTGCNAFARYADAGARDYSRLPEELQRLVQSVETSFEPVAPMESSGIKIMNLNATTEHAERLQNIIDRLPPELHNLIASSRMKFKAVDRIEDFSLNKPKERGLLKPDQQTVYIADQFERSGMWISESSTLERVVRHEVGHLIDRAATSPLSQQKQIFDAYRIGVQRMPGSIRRQFDYFATGDAKGASEVFAEIYAQLKTRGVNADTAKRTLFKNYFPEMIDAISSLNLP